MLMWRLMRDSKVGVSNIQHKIYSMSFSSIYLLYVAKIQKKGKVIEELHEIVEWLTGYTSDALTKIIDSEVTLQEFFENAPILNSKRTLITGVICGIRVENIDEPLMQQIRYLDKLVDELAKGKKMASILRH